jgi:hypothetical protein
VSGELHAPAVFPPGKNTIEIEYGVGWASEPKWTFWNCKEYIKTKVVIQL